MLHISEGRKTRRKRKLKLASIVYNFHKSAYAVVKCVEWGSGERPAIVLCRFRSSGRLRNSKLANRFRTKSTR